MSLNKVCFKRLSPNAILPTWTYESSAGADLYACLDTNVVKIPPNTTVPIPLGFSTEFDKNYVALVFARGGTALKKGIAPANKVGVIDADYRGEWFFLAHNHTDISITIENGERIGQVLFVKVEHPSFKEVSEDVKLSETIRGDKCLNSSGID